LSFAAVLDRAIAEARVHAPETGLAVATLLAALQAPARMAANRRTNARERRAVEAIYDELQATGTVEHHLPEEERRVRDRYAAEVLALRAPAPEASQAFPFRPRERVVTRIDREREARRREAALAPGEVIPLRRPGEMVPASAIVPVAAASAHASAAPPNVTRQPMLFVVPSSPPPGAVVAGEAAAPSQPVASVADGAREAAMPHESAPAAATRRRRRAGEGEGAGGEEEQLTLDDDIADGPVGSKTVKRLRTFGIATVRDLLKADPEALAALIDARGVTAQTVGAWQDQALLMCSVPGLKAAHAQLLEGAGYRSAEAIAAAVVDKLCADVIAFAATPAGQRMLRSGEVPDIERIKAWLEAARRVRAA
jgi:hypothetical protein